MSGGVEGSAELRIEGAAKRFGELAALDGVSLQVVRGELLTILGPSGSGKTTLLEIVAGFEKPDAGSVRIDGVEITALPPARRDIGMCGYAVLWNAFKRLAAGCSPTQKTAQFSGTAARVYKLALP
ncbi:MAG: ATP-binding cassette domain-containing protein [Reyranella sp.]|nr:ATP-binding cassette domain-containing protein [Reyranella sp.]